MISMNCFDVGNGYESEGGARSAREDKIVVVNNKADRMVVVDRDIVDRLTQNGPRVVGKAVVNELVDAVDVAAAAADVVDAVADAAVVVSQLAGIPNDRKVSQRFAKMGRARVVVVVLDPSSR
jgi:hypothetical protein